MVISSSVPSTLRMDEPDYAAIGLLVYAKSQTVGYSEESPYDNFTTDDLIGFIEQKRKPITIQIVVNGPYTRFE